MRKLGIFIWVFMLVGCAAREPALAQFIGFTSPQTTQEQVFTGVATGTFTQNVANRGQNTHIFNYRLVSGTVDTLEATIEASHDGTNFFTISDTARAVTQGITTASGYFPLVRCRLVITGTTPVMDGFYSGTSIALERPRGLTDASAISTSVITTTGSATGSNLFTFNPLNRNAGGQILFQFDTTPTGTPDGCEISFIPFSAIGGLSVPQSSHIFHLPLITGLSQRFIVPNVPADLVEVRYTCNTFPTGGTFSIFHVAGNVYVPQGNFVRLPALSAIGATDPIPVTRPSHFTTAIQESYSIALGVKNHTVQLNVTGAPATCTFQLEGSLDQTGGGSGGTFFLLGTSQVCTTNILFTVVNEPVLWIRGNLMVLTGGASPTVTMRYLGVQ